MQSYFICSFGPSSVLHLEETEGIKSNKQHAELLQFFHSAGKCMIFVQIVCWDSLLAGDLCSNAMSLFCLFLSNI